MIDSKYILSREQIKALSKKDAIEFYNAWANYWRCDVGINVLPAAWRIIDKEKKFIPIIPWKEFQNKPIPEKLFQEWIDNGSFVTGIAGIFGPVWHRPDKKGYYFGQIDADNALAIKEIIAWKGDANIAAFAKRTIVEQHEDNIENSMHVGLYSKNPLVNKDPDVSKSEKDKPSFEVHCVGRMGIMSASKHRKGYPMMLLNNAATEPMTCEDSSFENYLNSVCIKYGLNPYLGNGNGHGGKYQSQYQKQQQDRANKYESGTPLSPEIIDMIKKRILDYDGIEILNGTRHKTLVKIAACILFKYSETESLTSLKDFFILVNEHYCKPPSPMQERDEIWDDAVEYVSRKKAEESNRILTVSEAVREKPGDSKVVRGTVVSVSNPFKVILKIAYRCLNCRVINEGQRTTSGPIIYPALQLKKPKKCVNCEEEQLEVADYLTEMDDGKIITLQNIDLSSDIADETLEVLLLGNNTKYTRAGEVVTINGSIYYGISNSGVPSNGRKTIALMQAKFVTYEDRRTLTITDNDIEMFYRMASYGKIDVLDILVNMFAPTVIGERDKKLACLRSMVGGNDENHRGRIHTLFVGDFGLAKSKITIEATKVIPNSRFITIQHASAKSALAIVEKNNDSTTLLYGPIPLSSGAIAGLDELQTWGLDEQSSILSVMEEGAFRLVKYGKDKSIKATPTIIATMNPQDIVYKNRTTLSKDEITMLKPLQDRFDQIFVFLDNRMEHEDRIFSDKHLTNITKNFEYNYDFLSKYLLYAKTLKVTMTEHARSMIGEFWVRNRRDKTLAMGNRALEALVRLCEATAKLRLKTVVDESIVSEVQECYKAMLEQQGKFVKTIEDPRIVATNALIEHVRTLQCAITFKELIKKMCDQEPFIHTWLFGGAGYSDHIIDLAGDSNKKYRELYERFFQRINQPGSKINITSHKPLTVVWQTAKITSTNDLNDSNDQKSNPPTKNIIAQNGDKEGDASRNGPNETLGPNQDTEASHSSNPATDFSIGEKENWSNRSFGSFAATANATSNKPPTYEYLEPVNAYRCNWCKGIFNKDTKDTNAAHPCNFKGRGMV